MIAMSQTTDMTLWRGRTDPEEGELGRRWHEAIRSPSQGGGIALLGFACDAGVARNQGRVGARSGPAAIRAALAGLPASHSLAAFDAGDVAPRSSPDDDGLENAQERLSASLAELLELCALPIVLGGGHEVAYGSFGGLARHLRNRMPGAVPRIGIVNLDAHFDLRLGERASSGTPFRQIAEDCTASGWPFHYCCLGVSEFANTAALFARAEALGVVWRRDCDMDLLQRDATLTQLAAFLSGIDHVYLTVDLDVLPASVAPGVSAPAARGVSLEIIEPLIDLVVTSGKLRLMDVAEMNPLLDIDFRTARTAARLVARVATATCRRS